MMFVVQIKYANEFFHRRNDDSKTITLFMLRLLLLSVIPHRQKYRHRLYLIKSFAITCLFYATNRNVGRLNVCIFVSFHVNRVFSTQ